MTESGTQTERSTTMTDSPMMKHLLDALEDGQDIGHYGRLTFVMVAQYFMDDDRIVKLLAKNPDVSEDEAKAMVAEVKGHGYNPPKRDKILEWQKEQDFTICPQSDDPDACNVYEQLKFPDHVYEHIGHYWEQKVDSASS